MANWSYLLPELLIHIVRRLTLYEDFVAFGSVCTSWRSIAIIEKSRFISNLTPWLMLAPEKGTDLRPFFSFSEDLTRQFMLTDAKGNAKRCFSSRGWLITIAKDLTMRLLHPFSLLQIELPPMTTFKDWEQLAYCLSKPHFTFISKFVLSSNPLYTSDYMVMILHGPRAEVAYSKPGDKSWTTIKKTCSGKNFDVTFYKGLFYVINCNGDIMACDMRSEIAVQVARMPCDLIPESFSKCFYFYLVESAGELLVVAREGVWMRPIEEGSKKSTYGVLGFYVFEVDLKNNAWTEKKNLGNRALFLGYNSSFSVEATHCKSNCIYFTDDCFESYFTTRNGGGKDMGIYNILDGSIEPHFRGSSYSHVNTPMWVQQSFPSSFSAS